MCSAQSAGSSLSRSECFPSPALTLLSHATTANGFVVNLWIC